VKVPEWLNQLILEEVRQFHGWWLKIRMDSLYKCRNHELRWFILENGRFKDVSKLPWEA